MRANVAVAGILLIVLVLLMPLLAFSAQASSVSPVSSVTITDPSADVKAGTPTWLDIVSASVSAGTTGNFSFSVTVMSAIPSPSALTANNTGIVEWFFCLQSNSSFSVSGWPTPNGNGVPDACQYFLVVVWTGSNFVSVAVNRTPELIGAAPGVTVIPFSIQSATISWSVARTLIGSPTSLGFLVGSETEQKADFVILNSTTVQLNNGNNSVHILDGDGGSNGALFAQWP